MWASLALPPVLPVSVQFCTAAPLGQLYWHKNAAQAPPLVNSLLSGRRRLLGCSCFFCPVSVLDTDFPSGFTFHPLTIILRALNSPPPNTARPAPSMLTPSGFSSWLLQVPSLGPLQDSALQTSAPSPNTTLALQPYQEQVHSELLLLPLVFAKFPICSLLCSSNSDPRCSPPDNVTMSGARAFWSAYPAIWKGLQLRFTPSLHLHPLSK